MAVWEHLNVDKAHIAYAILGVFSAVFSLVSLFVKEKLYIGEATVAAIVGLIVGPHCLNWFAPTTWGNTDYITLEVSRIVLCLQIFAVAVELPKKYMLKHWVSVFMLLVPVMTSGWLIVGLFVWLLIPGLNFAEGLTVAACITATDPVLAAAVVGKGKFARRVPGHLRNLLSAESGCNDGMAFPFIYLGINLVIHAGNAGEIVKDWICVTLLYECILGCVIGVFIGYVGRHAIRFAEQKGLIDRESFLAFYVVLAFACAGFGSMLGVDDLLVSFAAGAAFAWNGWFAKKTEETHVSTVIDLLLNLGYFVYFGAIIPWNQFNDSSLGLDVWRLIILAIVVIFLRRIPAVLALKPLIPDIKTWREALFCGHFGPIGVGAVFAAILARASLEGAHTLEATPTKSLPDKNSEYFQLIAVIWPITTFLIITSIIVHGSSVAVITLGRHLNTMAISMSFTTTGGNANSSSWMQRLPELKNGGGSFSIHRVDTLAPSVNSDGKLSHSNTIETTGIPAKPAGGMRRKDKKKNKKNKNKHLLKRIQSHHNDMEPVYTSELRQREKEASAAAFALGGARKKDNDVDKLPEHNEEGYIPNIGITPRPTFTGAAERFPGAIDNTTTSDEYNEKDDSVTDAPFGEDYDANRRPTNLYTEGTDVLVEDQHGEILEHAKLAHVDGKPVKESGSLRRKASDSSSVTSMNAIERILSSASEKSAIAPKYTAFKVNDTLIIENSEGEVIRRYKINHHGNKPSDPPRTRSSTLSKALSAVGLKSKRETSDVEVNTFPHKVPIVPQPIEDEEEEAEEAEEEEEQEEQEEEEDDDDDDIDGDTDDSDEEENEVERARRLTALGKLEVSRPEEDEEDDSPFVLKSSNTLTPTPTTRRVGSQSLKFMDNKPIEE